jgi:hypothetical protein
LRRSTDNARGGHGGDAATLLLVFAASRFADLQKVLRRLRAAGE